MLEEVIIKVEIQVENHPLTYIAVLFTIYWNILYKVVIREESLKEHNYVSKDVQLETRYLLLLEVFKYQTVGGGRERERKNVCALFQKLKNSWLLPHITTTTNQLQMLK